MITQMCSEELKSSSEENWKDTLKCVLEYLQREDTNNFFITCFTKRGDQLSQWRGYASDGYGYSIGFDTTKFLNIEPPFVAYNVLYAVELQQKLCISLLRTAYNAVSDVISNHGYEQRPALVCQFLAFYCYVLTPILKNASFEEESEIRLCFNIKFQEASKKNLLFCERKGILVPHIPIQFAEGKLPIREIIVGPNLNFEQAKWSLQQFLEQQGYAGVEIKKSAIPYIS